MSSSSKSGPVLGCRFYRSAAGTEPVRDWLRAQTLAVKKAIGEDINEVQWRWPVGKPLVDGFGGALWEVRTSHDREEYRVLFTLVGADMVLLHGLHKKSRATPKAVVELARARMKEIKP